MKKRFLSRRTMLRGMLQGAAISVALPPLEAMLGSTGKAYADGSAFPKRFGLFMWGNGVVPDNWIPAQTGRNYQLSPILAPLAPVQDSIAVITGTSVMTANVEPHLSGAAGILSGAPLVSLADETFMLPSIDQVIANAIGNQTRFQSIQFGADPGSGLSYNGPDNQNPPQSSPQELFNQLFVNGFTPPGQTPAPNPMLAVRASILDAVINDASALRTRLGATDRARLDQHLTGIRELEMRLSNTKPPVLASCRVPPVPAASYPDINGLPDLVGLNKAFCDIVALALACDQTRVFSNYFTYPVSNPLFPGAIEGHHQLTHDELDTTVNGTFMQQPQVTAICVQIMQQFAYQLEALRAIPEGDGTLLDHCVLLGTTDCSFGRTHSLNEYPIVLAGTANGALPTGFHYRSTTNENSSEVLLSIVQAMDVPVASFGAGAGLATKGLPALAVS
jgi:hypothetical protein